MKSILSTICVILLGLITYQVMSYPNDLEEADGIENDNKAHGPQDLRFDLPELGLLKDISQYSEIIKRPLFTKNRLPAKKTHSLNAVKNNDIEGLILIGVVKSTDVQIGIVSDTKEEKIERLKIGHVYKGWKISEIAKDYIVFQDKDSEYKLFLTPIESVDNKRRGSVWSKEKKNTNDYKRPTYKGWGRPETQESIVNKKKNTGSIYKYKKTENVKNSTSSSVRKLPINNDVEEKSADYYEALDDDSDDLEYIDNEDYSEELTADDFYADDEDISEEELKVLKALGVEIFDD